jgi:hypothetical protein
LPSHAQDKATLEKSALPSPPAPMAFLVPFVAKDRGFFETAAKWG